VIFESAPASLWTAAEAAAGDRHTIAGLGMPSAVLMERAALCVSAEVEALAAARGLGRVLVLVGPGNNGGDGLAVARLLHGRGGLKVTAVLVTDRRNAAATEQLELARAHGVEVLAALPERAPADAVLVDALLGTGSRGAARGAIAAALEWLENAEDAGPVLAVDVPSGIEVDTGAVCGVAVRAAVTVTFQRSKPGLHLTPGRGHAGRVVVADIGLHGPASATLGLRRLIDPGSVAAALAGVPAAEHKGRRGHVGVLGGTGGTPGAAVLVGEAALRGGAGLATLAMADAQLRRALLEVRPELMLSEVDDPRVAGADVLVVGPGLTGARSGLAELDAEDARPMVWDASALADFDGSDSAGPRILTPHPGEAARMLARLGDDPSWTNARVQGDRRAAAEQLAIQTRAIVVLKGEGSVVARARAGGEVELAIACTGGPALATAGSGDVLAGLLAALLARGLDPWVAAQVGVHVHGLAGDAAALDGTLALDLAEGLPRALAAAARGERPRSWPSLRRG
jgi:ADP-dependent NAD(P)H-hydrate dehydratase / NAD(P)H-hydrate epimerase